MNRAFAIVLAVAAVAALAQTTLPAAAASTAQAKAELKDVKGRPAGTATFTESGGMVKLKLNATGLDAGKHGIHVHEVGKCDPPDFESAGAHFNPHGRKHGVKAAQGAHAGDLPNLVASTEGLASADMTMPGVTLAKGEKNSLLDKDGSALVIHAKEDDEVTDPAGNSGDRLICGVVTAAP